MPVWHCKTVGGTTVHWTASAPRLQPWELRAKSTYGKLAGTSLIDWPISYDELEKYYIIAERRLGVARRNDVPRLPASNNFKVMYAGARKLGYKQVHTGHMAINSRSNDGRGFCIQQGFACKGARWARSGALSTPKSRMRRPPATWTCGSNRRPPASTMGLMDLSTPWCIAIPRGKSNDKKRGWSASREMRSRPLASCCFLNLQSIRRV
jgi:choline dehydrogenase-like flavoprotein